MQNFWLCGFKVLVGLNTSKFDSISKFLFFWLCEASLKSIFVVLSSVYAGGSMPWGNITNMFKKVPKKALEKIVFTKRKREAG